MKIRTAVLAVTIAVGAGGGATYWVLDHGRTQRPTNVVEHVTNQVPGAKEVLAFSGKGFTLGPRGQAQSDKQDASTESRARTIQARLPEAATGVIAVGPSGAEPFSLKLSGSRPAPLELENGRGVYRNVRDGVDVIAIRDPEHLELAYVVIAPSRPTVLSFELTAREEGSRLALEPTTGAAVMRSKAGRALLRVAPPVALDAAGVVRTGSYELRGNEITIAMNLSDLEPPVLVDPRFAIPFWSILSDGRAPGALSYDPTSTSREVRLAFDESRGKAVLVRPARTQQPEDTVTHFGVFALSPNLRQAPESVFQPTAELRADWDRTSRVGSETWQWSGSRWELLPAVGLPGFIDPALAYDRERGRLSVAAGAAPGPFCQSVTSTTDLIAFTIGSQIVCEVPRSESLFELQANQWTARPIAASPPPRVRAAVVSAPPYMMLFGGRALKVETTRVEVAPYGRPYPDSLVGDLLNDTWRFDGVRWERIPTANSPTPRQGATLVYDERRKVTVLSGGFSADGVDALDLWEFDGVDWVERISAGDSSLPVSLKTRSGMMVTWNPVRQTTLLFGGKAAALETCVPEDPQVTGCSGGYMHDSWEWDGRSLRQITQVAYGGQVRGMSVFRQVSDADGGWLGSPPETNPSTPAGGVSPLHPFRYDSDPNHFRLRSTLERAHAPADASGPRIGAPPESIEPTPAGSTATPTFVSPLFAPSARPDIVFDRVRNKALLVTPEDGRIFETNGATWTETTPAASPFSTGAQDFFASTWDAPAQRIVLFDPRTASTWLHSDASGWTKATPAASPPAWSVDPEIRRIRDFNRLSKSAGLQTSIVQQLPKMTYDRARARTLMLYGGALWQFDGTTWAQGPAPPGWSACPAATLLAYDGSRSRVIAVGCKVPAETVEWDGSSWQGPLPSPYTARVGRGRVLNDPDPKFALGILWHGTLQLPWAHPNALFESPLNGGVSTFDADGTLKTWNGTAWVTGPRLPEGYSCDAFDANRNLLTQADSLGIGLSFNGSASLTKQIDFVPVCLFPPAIEDAANGRLLAFRDGPTAMRELRISSVPSADRRWEPVLLGHRFGTLPPSVSGEVRMHANPFELLSPEHLTLYSMADPATKSVDYFDESFDPVRDNWRINKEALVNNLFWPFRLFLDPASKRIRVLTDRGVVWELGAELRKGLGEPCEGAGDCGEGTCLAKEKICCNDSACESKPCATCAGASPGYCMSVPAGQPDPHDRCGTGECAGYCPGSPRIIPGQPTEVRYYCAFDATRACGAGTTCADGMLTAGGHCHDNVPGCIASALPPAPCAAGFGCASATSCKTTCTSRADCKGPFEECRTDGTGCQPDAVSAAANSIGVQPTTWTPSVRRTPEEVAALLRNAGFQADDAGRILFDGFSLGGLAMAFDPNLKTPLEGFRNCLHRIQACRVATGTLDACVAAMPRCQTATPWLDDPAGFDCCPTECLIHYFDQRAAATPRDAATSLSQAMCYPGLETYLEGL